MAAWPEIRRILAGWLKSRSLSHQVAAVDRLMKAMTLGLAWEPAQGHSGLTLVIHLSGGHGGTVTLPVGQGSLPAGAERGQEAWPALEVQGAVIHHGRKSQPEG